MKSVEDIKKDIIAGVIKPGDQFLNKAGATGTYIPELSARGKLQARFNCTWHGCPMEHVREISDWHQCGKCEAHAKIRLRDIGRKRPKKGVNVAQVRDDLAKEDAYLAEKAQSIK